jgi:hypothetical protein
VQTYKTYLKIPSALVVARSNSQGIFVFNYIMEKKCTKCGEVKSLQDFGNRKDCKEGKRNHCKICKRQYYNDYIKKNKDKIKKDRKAYNIKNKDKNKSYSLEWRDKNKYYSAEYFKLRKKTDLLFKLRCNISSNMSSAIKRQGYSKKTKTYNILKCNYDFFMQYLNGIASNGYTYGIGDLHLDHVIPISLAETEDEILLLSHYSNYQLLSADENLAKSNRYVNPVNLARVLEHHPNPDKIREIHSRL